MAELSAAKLSIIERLAWSAPDGVLRNLEAALASAPDSAGAMGEVRRLLAAEGEDRRVRSQVFAPVLPLFGPAPTSLGALRFPPAALRDLWRGVKALAPNETAAVAAQMRAAPDEAQALDTVCDSLCRTAGEALLMSEAAPFTAIRDALGEAVSHKLAICLELAPVARRALTHLHEWLGRMNGERAAVARLTYKDACAIADDAGPCLMEILAARLDEPSHVVRLVSAFMDKPSDTYAASSELGMFGERVLSAIERRVTELKAFDLSGGAEAGCAAGTAVHRAIIELTEFEQDIALAGNGPWGRRAAAARKAIAELVEPRLRKGEELVAAALPLQPGASRAARGQPRLDHPLDSKKAAQARALTSFIDAVHSASATAGFGASRAKAVEKIQQRLDQYVEDLLAMLREHPEGAALARIREHLELAADCLADVTEADAAQIVRRRAAAALAPDTHDKHAAVG